MYLLAADRKADNIWLSYGFPPTRLHCAMSATWLQRGCVCLLSCSKHASVSISVGRASSSTLGHSSICRVISSRHPVLLPVAAAARCSLAGLSTSVAPPPGAVRSRRLASNRPSNFFEKVSGLRTRSLDVLHNLIWLHQMVVFCPLYAIAGEHMDCPQPPLADPNSGGARTVLAGLALPLHRGPIRLCSGWYQ